MADDSNNDKTTDNKVEYLPNIDASEFRVAASDMQGHSTRKSIRMAPMMANFISVLLADKRFPYRTEGELMRHAVARHIKYLEKLGDVPSVSAQLDAMNAVLEREQQNAFWMETFNRVGPRITEYINTGDYAEARRLFKELQAHVNRMPDGYWKTRSMKMLWDQHGWVMRREYDIKSRHLATAIEETGS